MKLFFHIGTEKTGSSFIQTQLARNRADLLKQGVFFPSDLQYDQRMKSGRISPGNAYEFQKHLRECSQAKAELWLKRRMERADDLGAGKLVLSNETFINALFEEGVFEGFRRITKRLKLSAINFLIVVRDPVEQALSLYKHRAKSSNLASPAEWVKSEYHIDRYLDSLLRQIERDDEIQITFKRYCASSQVLQERFFTEWLGIVPPTVPEGPLQRVNRSLTLSELAALGVARNIRPALVESLYPALYQLDGDLKADEKELEEAFSLSFIPNMSYNRKIWLEISNFLPSDQRLEVCEVKTGVLSDSKLPEYRFSAEQLRELIQSVSKASTFRFRMHHWFNLRVRPLLARIKWKLLEVTGLKMKV